MQRGAERCEECDGHVGKLLHDKNV